MNDQQTQSAQREARSSPPSGSTITITDETCLLHSDIDPNTNRATAALDGWAHDDDGNEWELSTYVAVKWKRTATGFGRCRCGGIMQSKAPKHPKARVRCNKCAAEMFLSNWLRISSNSD